MTAEPHLDDGWASWGVGWGIAASMLGGILVWGGIGYLIDKLLGTPQVFTAVGFVLGAVGGIIIVYLRYGREGRGQS